MATKKHADIGYITGVLTETGVIGIIAAAESLENDDVSHSFLAVHKEKAWKVFQEDFDIVSIACGRGAFARHVGYLGLLGDVTINEPTGPKEEHVHKGKAGPSNLRTMNELRAVGDWFLAVGMRRQVFHRKVAGGAWSRFDAGVLLDEASLDIAGFLSVDGFGNDEIYAVGYRGEIWLRDAKAWQQIDSPTSVRLECVRRGGDDTVVACGEDGVVVIGRGQQWALVDANGIDSTLKSAVWFKDRWYFADEDGGVFTIGAAGLEADAAFAKLDATTGTLDANGTHLLSIGEEDIFLFDGKKWQRVPHPPIDPT